MGGHQLSKPNRSVTDENQVGSQWLVAIQMRLEFRGKVKGRS